MNRLSVVSLLLLAACGSRVEPEGPVGSNLPSTFLLGTSTASHQIEGNNKNNDWWDWEHADAGHIRNGDTSERAAGSWGRFQTADLPLMKQLGSNAYRFSLEWSRIEPAEGQWDEAALAEYVRFARDLRAAGIDPMVTLFHWTLPRWVAAKGGFENRETLEHFDRFVARVASAMGGSVDTWCTLNEPNVYVVQAYMDGVAPPGVKDSVRAAQVLANELEAYARAAKMLRENDVVDADGDGKATFIGLAHHVRAFESASSSVADTTITAVSDDFFNESTVRALATGRIQLEVPGELSLNREVDGLAGATDWLGLNYYTRNVIRADLGNESLSDIYVPEGRPTNQLGWEIDPEGLTYFLERFSTYPWPMIVTENGVPDSVGDVRPRFLQEHIRAIERAAANGVDVRGYYHWTLMDNFEWEDGYYGAFGLYTVDRDDPNFTRHCTRAVNTFRGIVRANGRTPAGDDCILP